MTYASQNLVQASDYNSFAGGNIANVSSQLNTILGSGKGNAGYGQAAVTNVTAVADTVTATQWTTLVNGVNKVRKHQSGAGFTNLSTYTAATIVNASNDIASNISTAYSNRLIFAANGTTTTGSTFSPNFTAPNDTNPATFNITRTATFASADQARYFFNAGGKLNFVVSGVTNTGGTNRGASLATLAATNFASMTFLASNNGGRAGSSGTVTSSNTSISYYTCTTSNTSVLLLTSTSSAYTNDTCNITIKTNGVQGSNNDNGSIMNLNMVLFSAGQSPAVDDSIDITVNHRVDVIYPSTTFLANTWGSVTIS
jgi:hypothetical protein